MNEVAPVQARPLVAGQSVRPIVPQDYESVFRLSQMIAASGMAPKDMNSPEKIAVAVLHGLELGLTPMAALQSIAVVNGRPSIWGDGALALVRASGTLDTIDEAITGEGDARIATCTVKRKGEPKATVRTFSVSDAKKAGLWGKSGPWSQYPDRMLQMRARAFALRDGFADILRGLAIADEQQDVQMRDITPPPPPPEPPSPPAAAGADLPIAATRQVQAPSAAAGPETMADRGRPQQDEFETFLDRLDGDFAKCGTVEELKKVWQTYGLALKALGEADMNRCRAALEKHKSRVAPPADVVDGKAFDLSAFLVNLDAEFTKAETFDVLDALFAELVDPRREAGEISRADIEGPIGEVYSKHRERIDFADFPGNT